MSDGKGSAQGEMFEKIAAWLDLRPLQEQYGMEVEEIDVSIACQYTGNQVVEPARSESCQISCLVEKAVILETLMCSCGKEIDEENYYKEDWELKGILELIRGKFGKKIKRIRVDLKGKQIKV